MTKGAVYPIIEHTNTEDGLKLVKTGYIVNLIIVAQKVTLVKFLKNPTFDTFETFMRDCAAEERRVLTENGCFVEEQI